MDIFAMYDTMQQGTDDENAMFTAAGRNELKEFKAQLEKNTSYNAVINGFNALHISCKKGHSLIVRAILDHEDEYGSITVRPDPSSINPGSNEANIVNVRTDNGRTPLMLASFEGHFEIVKLLHQYMEKKHILEKNDGLDAIRDDMGNCHMHWSAWGGHLEIVKYLVETVNCPTLIKNNEGLRPIHFAAAGNHCQVFEYFLSLSPDDVSSDSDSTSGFNCLHRAAIANALDVIKVIVQKKLIPVDSVAKNGSTALHLAAHYGFIDVVTYLLENSNSIEIINMLNLHKLTPLHLAATAGHTQIVKKLMSSGAVCSLRSLTGSTPLHAAASNGAHDLIELFFRKEEEEDESNYDKNEEGKEKEIEVIDFDTEDEEGNTCIDEALSSGYKDLASRLAFYSYIQNLHSTIGENEALKLTQAKYEYEFPGKLTCQEYLYFERKALGLRAISAFGYEDSMPLYLSEKQKACKLEGYNDQEAAEKEISFPEFHVYKEGGYSVNTHFVGTWCKRLGKRHSRG